MSSLGSVVGRGVGGDKVGAVVDVATPPVAGLGDGIVSVGLVLVVGVIEGGGGVPVLAGPAVVVNIQSAGAVADAVGVWAVGLVADALGVWSVGAGEEVALGVAAVGVWLGEAVGITVGCGGGCVGGSVGGIVGSSLGVAEGIVWLG